MRVIATWVVGAVALLAVPMLSRADTIRFTAQLASDTNISPRPTAAQGSAVLSLDTATKTVSWTIAYSGLPGPPQGVACGALEGPGGPAIRLTSNLASPITGSKPLSDSEIAALSAGSWACVIGGESDDPEIGGVLQPAR